MNELADHEELYALLGDLCNDALTADRLARLEERLRADAAARDFYWDYMSLHSELSWRESAAAALSQRAGQLEIPAVPAIASRPARLFGFLKFNAETSFTSAMTYFVMAMLLSGIALTIALCVALIYHATSARLQNGGPAVARSVPQTHPKRNEDDAESTDGAHGRSEIMHPSSGTVARLIRTHDCHWAVGSHSPKTGDDIEAGRKLVLLSGLAEVMFQSGVRAVLQGPASMEVESPAAANLRQGKVTVCVEDPDARGFVVRAAGMKYTDLGTEFGVWVAKDGEQEVHVFRGKVRAEVISQTVPSEHQTAEGNRPAVDSGDRQPASLVLSASQAIHVSSGGMLLKPMASEDRKFVRHEQMLEIIASQSPQYARWRASAGGLCKAKDVVAYYDFQPDEADQTLLRNRVAGGQKLDGRIQGANWCEGSFAGKKALQFTQPGACVKVDIPGRFEVLTIAARIKLMEFRSPYASILDSNGWHVGIGQCHWQIQSMGNLELAACFLTKPSAKEWFNTTTSKKPVIAGNDGGAWIYLAAVYNSRHNTVAYYKNGKLCETVHPPVALVPLFFGPSEIGNWDNAGEDPLPKQLFGTIDELFLVSRELGVEELKSIYEAGRP